MKYSAIKRRDFVEISRKEKQALGIFKLFHLNCLTGGVKIKKDNFLNSPSVLSFIEWIQPKLDEPDSFVCNFTIKRLRKTWSCTSLYSAFESYWWPFRSTLPPEQNWISGETFEDSSKFLTQISSGLCRSIHDNDNGLCRDYCHSVLKWGGVKARNEDLVEDLGDSICDYFKSAKERLNSNDSSINCNTLKINSGFTKIYALIINDFIIYDGRVGAALGLLVRKFCEDNKMGKIPQELLFGYKRGREANYNPINRRNPSAGKYVFPELSNNPKKHIDDNIRANWLLKSTLENSDSRFNGLNPEIQLLALQSALFMVGYDVANN